MFRRLWIAALIATAGLFGSSVQAHGGHGHHNHGHQGNRSSGYNYRQRDYGSRERRSTYRSHNPNRMHNPNYRNGRHKDKDYYYDDESRRSYGYDYRGYGKKSYTKRHRKHNRSYQGHGDYGHYHRRDPLARVAARLLASYFYCPEHDGYFRNNDLYYYD